MGGPGNARVLLAWHLLPVGFSERDAEHQHVTACCRTVLRSMVMELPRGSVGIFCRTETTGRPAGIFRWCAPSFVPRLGSAKRAREQLRVANLRGDRGKRFGSPAPAQRLHARK